MIRKFGAVHWFSIVSWLWSLTILAGTATVYAQQTPAQPPQNQQPASNPPAAQQPDSQQPSTQETQETQEEESSSRRRKPKAYKNWTFNAGGGASLTNGTTTTFVRGGGGVAAVGVARNYSKYFGFRLDVQFDNLPLRNTALQLAQATGASSHVYIVNLDPIVNIPVTKSWGGYLLAGPGYYHRTGKLDSSTALPGLACNPFFTWWGRCYNGSLPVNGNFLSESQNQFGYNFGAGITRKIRPNIEIYGEFRQLHGSHSGITTDLRPITIGVRWGR